MGDELKGFEETAPTLTLEPDLGEAKPAAPAVPEAEAVKAGTEKGFRETVIFTYRPRNSRW